MTSVENRSEATTNVDRRRRPRGRALVAPGGGARTIALVLAVVLVLAAIVHLVVQRVTALPDDAVLRVGGVDGVTVSEQQFRQRLTVLTALYGVQPPPPGPERDRFEQDAAQAVAASIVLDRAAAERNVVVPEPVAQDALTKIIDTQFAPTGRPAFAQALGALRISEADVLAEIRRQLSTSRLFADVTQGTPPVTDADVAAAFEQRRGEMQVPERRRLLNIVTDGRERADAAAAQLRAGAPFAPLAASTSLDRATAGTGGDLGVLAADQLERPIADAAFGVPPGSVFGPVQGRYGWNVGQVTEVVPAQPLALDQVRDALRARLVEERTMDRWRPWFVEQVRAADVEYAPRYRPADPEALPSQLTR